MVRRTHEGMDCPATWFVRWLDAKPRRATGRFIRRSDSSVMGVVVTIIALSMYALAAGANSQEAPDREKPGLKPSQWESKYLSNIEQLTHDSMGLLNAGEAYFSPDAKTIILQATPHGKDDYQIYTMNLATREFKMVSTGKGACTCAFFRPDGKRIIFASSHLDPNVDVRS